MNSFEVKMNDALRKMATNVIPSDVELKQANICLDKIIKLIQTKSKYDIGHVCISGSTGKKTTIVGSDVDCVFFVNRQQPLFSHVLDDFEDILTLNMTDSYKIRDTRKTKYSLQFNTLFDFEFDILPAVNFTEGIQIDSDRLIDMQQKRALDFIKQNPDKYGYMYSSSLADATTRFMKRQGGFVNEMVRITKCWYKTLHFDNYVSGAKSCIELIAVRAANQEEQMEKKSYLRSFKRFIGYVANFDNLNIYFGDNDHQSRPCVVDPVNPYNNLVKNWDRKSIELIQNYAKETDRRLQHLASVHRVEMDQLFEPQPVFRPSVGGLFGKNASCLIGSHSFFLQRDLKIRNKHFLKDYKFLRALEILKIYFQFAISAAKASGHDGKETNIIVKNMISKQIYNGSVNNWTSSENKHEDYDLTFTIPVSDDEAICISFTL